MGGHPGKHRLVSKITIMDANAVPRRNELLNINLSARLFVREVSEAPRT